MFPFSLFFEFLYLFFLEFTKKLKLKKHILTLNYSDLFKFSKSF